MVMHCVINDFRLVFPAIIRHTTRLTPPPSPPSPLLQGNLSHHSRLKHYRPICSTTGLFLTAYENKKRHTLSSSSSPTTTAAFTAPTQTRSMASDSDYMAFLDKANAQRDAATSHQGQPSKEIRTETVETGVRVPDALKRVDTYYVSETDEPFEPVALRWEGAARGTWPGPEKFASLITGSPSAASDLFESGSIETLSPDAFDPKGRYTAVFRAVRTAAVASDASNTVDESGIDVKVYRVEVGKSRVEYWVLALDVAEGRIVGLRAKAVET